MAVPAKKSVLKLYDGLEQLNEYKVDYSSESKVVHTYPVAAEFSGSTYKFTGSAGVVDDMVGYALTLRSDVDNASDNVASEISRVESLITAEETARLAGDSAASTARSTITTNLNAEITRATAAEGVNAAAIASETGRAEDAEGVLQSNIDAEQAARVLALSTEATTRANEDAAEATARLAGDADLESKINTEKARIDAILNLSSSDLDTFKEIADAYQNADSNLQTLITNLTTDLSQLRADFDAHFPQDDAGGNEEAQQSYSQAFTDYANSLILKYANYIYRTPSNDYFTNITKIYTSTIGAYFRTNTSTESQVWYQWLDPNWSFGEGVDPTNGGFVRKYITDESEIPSAYAQLN